jgi:hypothetical protein
LKVNGSSCLQEDYVKMRILACATQENGIIICKTTSGNNNPADQCKKFKGPIPTGRWKIGVPDPNDWAPLTEVYGNNTNCQCESDRTGLYMHPMGKRNEGCIAIDNHMNCRKRIMESLRNEGGGDLVVVE